MFHRIVSPLKSNSFFLFGARGTGKTTFLKDFFSDNEAEYINLLNAEDERIFSKNPSELEFRINHLSPEKKWIVIDELQKVPALLNVVHKLIEENKVKFAMTGSSGRKLRHGGSNLLAGRAFVNHLHPLTLRELENKVTLADLLHWGSLPKAINSAEIEDKREFLRSYAHTYLREEIAAEMLVRKLDPFRNFLEVAAQCNGQIVNAARLGREVSADIKTVQTYFSILEDTHMGFLLPMWHNSLRKRQATHPKFYFFDLGVKRALERSLTGEITEGSYAFGNAFEHLLVLEFFRMNDYLKKDFKFSYLRTHSGSEIDLIADRPGKPVALIEIKSANHILENDCKTLQTFTEEINNSEAFCISRDPHRKKIKKVQCLPFKDITEIFG